MNGKTLTAEQCSKLSLYILMTTKTREGEAEAWEKLAEEKKEDGSPKYIHAADNAQFWRELDADLRKILMFDDETSAEVPEHEEWLHSKCFPLLEREYGIKTQIVQGKYTYTDCFYKQYEKGGKVGKIWGFPFLRGAWCNTRLKVRPIQAHIKALGEFTEIVGIAADETNRIERKTVAGKILPLVERGITEAQAFDVCRSRGLLSPGYNGGRERLGCWFCHNQRVGELKRLYYDYPELWNKLAKLDRDSPVTFKPGKTLADFGRRFSLEGMQEKLF